MPASRHTISRFAFTQSVRSVANSQSKRRRAARHGFDERNAEALASGRQGEEIGRPVEVHQFGKWRLV
jgi:hypothetical protein